MEFILRDTDIFDMTIDQKFKEIIVDNNDFFSNEYVYVLKVSFHVNLLNDPRFLEFNTPIQSKIKEITKKDKIYDVMDFQLKKIEAIFKETGIETYSTTIKGEKLEAENIIKIEISKDTSEPTFTGRGKNKKRMKVSCIIPSSSYIEETIEGFRSERISKMYLNLLNNIRSKKVMSDILEIEETEDDNKLLNAFIEQYGELWFTTKDREEELQNKLKERLLFLVKKYSDTEN